MHRLVCKFSSVVTPPFLYGHRHPRIAGLIRFNDEISSEAQRVLQRMVFSENKFFSHLDPQCIDLVEIVSDDTVSRSDNPNLIESGTGVVIRTSVDVFGLPKIPCGISLGFQGVGIRNDSKKYFANQVKTFSDDYLTDHVMDQGGGIVLTCHKLDDEENNIIDLPNGHEVLTDLLEVVDVRGSRNGNNQKLLTNKDFENLYEPCIRFDPQSGDSSRLVGVFENDTLMYGGSLTNENILVDPFITVDSPGEDICLGARKMVFSSSDKYMHNLFPNAKIRYVVTGKIVGDDMSPNLISLLKNRPWVLRGLLV